MVRIRQVDSTAKLRLRHRTKGFEDREPYRQAIQGLEGDAHIELSPEVGESLRRIKLNLARASKEVQKPISYAETTDGSVIAWLSDTDSVQRRRRGRPRKTIE